jgi:hypothetical protein
MITFQNENKTEKMIAAHAQIAARCVDAPASNHSWPPQYQSVLRRKNETYVGLLAFNCYFPVFVPSLSWQIFGSCCENLVPNRRFRTAKPRLDSCQPERCRERETNKEGHAEGGQPRV